MARETGRRRSLRDLIGTRGEAVATPSAANGTEKGAATARPAAPASTHVCLLGLNGGPTDPLVLKLGTEFAKASKAPLVAVHVIEVDWSHELTEETQETTEIASAVLDMAEAAAEKSGVTLDTLLLRARDVGAALVDEAAAIEAQSIVLGLPFRKKFGGEFAIGRTVPYVLQNAPCGVIVVREPIATSEARGRGDADSRAGSTAAPAQIAAG